MLSGRAAWPTSAAVKTRVVTLSLPGHGTAPGTRCLHLETRGEGKGCLDARMRGDYERVWRRTASEHGQNWVIRKALCNSTSPVCCSPGRPPRPRHLADTDPPFKTARRYLFLQEAFLKLPGEANFFTLLLLHTGCLLQLLSHL